MMQAFFLIPVSSVGELGHRVHNDSAEGSGIEFRISGSLQSSTRGYMVIMILKVLTLTGALNKQSVHSINKAHRILARKLWSCKILVLLYIQMWFLDAIKNKWRWHNVFFTGLRNVGHFCWSSVHFCPFKKQGLWHRASTCPTPCVTRAIDCQLQCIYCNSACPNQLLFQARISVNYFPHLLFFFFASRTAFFHCLCSSWVLLWQWERAWRSEWSFHFLFLRKCCLYYKEEIKVVNL